MVSLGAAYLFSAMLSLLGTVIAMAMTHIRVPLYSRPIGTIRSPFSGGLFAYPGQPVAAACRSDGLFDWNVLCQIKLIF